MAALVAGIALVAAGCGGDDTDGGGETTTVSGANERLTSEQWSSYLEAGDAFREARVAAQTKLAACPASYTEDLDVYEACIGESLDALVAAATELGDTLESFGGTVSGSCEASLNAFIGYVTPFVASVELFRQTVSDDNVAGVANAKASVETALEGGRAESENFERDCAPL